MIEGTKPQKKNSAPHAAFPTKIETRVDAAEKTAAPTDLRQNFSASDAANPERRKAFAQALPELGNGLVKLLRASNNLKSDLEALWKTRN